MQDAEYQELPNDLSSPVLLPVVGVDELATHTEHDAIWNRTRPSTPPPSTLTTLPVPAAPPPPPLPPSTQTELCQHSVRKRWSSGPRQFGGGNGGSLETCEQFSPCRRRHSVIRSRKRTRTSTRPMSQFGRTPFKPLPTPPGSTQATISTRNPSLLSSPEV